MPILIEIADKGAPKLKRALLDALEAARKRLSRGDLTRLIESGNLGDVVQLLQNSEDDFGSFLDQIDDIVRESGAATASMIPAAALVNPNFRFDSFSENSMNFIRQYRTNLVRNITEETREAIQQHLIHAVQTGQNPRTTARRLKETLGLTRRQEQAIRNYRTALENLETNALYRSLRDKRFDKTIRSAIKTNRPLTQTQINRMVERYRSKSLAYRAEMIARTESLRASSVGNRASITQMMNEGAIDPGNVRRQWVYTHDKRTRSHHRSIPSLNEGGVAMDGAYVTEMGPLAFPRDPAGSASNTINCRCTERYFAVA